MRRDLDAGDILVARQERHLVGGRDVQHVDPRPLRAGDAHQALGAAQGRDFVAPDGMGGGVARDALAQAFAQAELVLAVEGGAATRPSQDGRDPLVILDQQRTRGRAHEHLDAGRAWQAFEVRDLGGVLPRAPDPEGEIAEHAMPPACDLVGQGIGVGGQGRRVRHLEHRRHPAQHGGARAGLQILLMRRARLAEMHLGVDHARQDMQARAIQNPVGGGRAKRPHGRDGAGRDAEVADRDPVLVRQGAAPQDEIECSSQADPQFSPAPLVPTPRQRIWTQNSMRHGEDAMSGRLAVLNDRAVIQVSGPDARDFLQGLVTNDVAGLAPGEARYAALLTPQGKITVDFFIVADREDTARFLLDAPERLAPDLMQKLNLYRLRAKVQVIDRSAEFGVIALADAEPPTAGGLVYGDPRAPGLWRRAIVPRGVLGDRGDDASRWAYRELRIRAGVPEGGLDFAYGETFPHEANLDRLNGVDFTKGCYVGQEVVSRVEHRGTARKRVIGVTFEGEAPAVGSVITLDDLAIGTMGSSVDGIGLGLVRLDRASDAGQHGRILAGTVPLHLEGPGWT